MPPILQKYIKSYDFIFSATVSL